jgi:DNA excision repair protein ERCC-6
LEEVISLLECDDDVELEEIYIEPPEVAVNSDVDSGNEDGGGTINNLSRNQLLSRAEIRFVGQDPIDDALDFQNQFDEQHLLASSMENVIEIPLEDVLVVDNEVSLQTNTPLQENCRHRRTPRKWTAGTISGKNMNPFPEHNYFDFTGKSEVDIFESMITDDIIDLFVEKTNNFSMYKRNTNPKITSKEIRCFIAILYFTGYNQVPARRLYWSSDCDVGNNLVKSTMRRDRFEEIFNNIHCCDVVMPNSQDKMWKLRPLIEKLRRNFKTQFVPIQNLSFDESMIRYYGRHGCKQFVGA